MLSLDAILDTLPAATRSAAVADELDAVVGLALESLRRLLPSDNDKVVLKAGELIPRVWMAAIRHGHRAADGPFGSAPGAFLDPPDDTAVGYDFDLGDLARMLMSGLSGDTGLASLRPDERPAAE